jgi:hypothetical protein
MPITEIKILSEGLDKDELISNFPYKIYIKERNRFSIDKIGKDLNKLDSLFPSSFMENRQVLSTCFTDSLYALDSTIFLNFDPDKFILLLQWVEQFKSYSLYDPTNDILYGSIHNYWMSNLVNSLSKMSRNSFNLKFNFKFRFLEAKCYEQGYSLGSGVRVSSLEKVIYNIVDSSWAHLFNSVWNQTNLIQKILFVIFFLIHFYIYLLFFNKIYIKLKNKKL